MKRVMLFLASLASSQAATADHPNIIFIMNDDHAAQAISAYGFRIGDVAPTPNTNREWSRDVKYLDLRKGIEFFGPAALFDDYAERSLAVRHQYKSIETTTIIMSIPIGAC